MRACCNKKEDNFITYHSNREKIIENTREWEKLNPEKRKEYTIKYYKTEKGHRKRLAQQKRYREKKKLIKENEKLKNDKMELLQKIDKLEQKNLQLILDGNTLVNSNEKLGDIVDNYKTVLDEIKEYLNNNRNTCYMDNDIDNLLQILDKVKEVSYAKN